MNEQKTYTGEDIKTIQSGFYWSKKPWGNKVPIWVAKLEDKIVLDYGYRCEVYIFLDERESDGYEDITLFGPMNIPDF